MKCDTTWRSNTEEHKGQECDCAACWSRGTHSCPGCDQCDGPVMGCSGPDPEEDY